MTDFDFDAWLDGVTPATTSVDILQDPALLADYDEWQRRYSRAVKTEPAERSMGDPDPIAALTAEGESLLARIEQSRTTWHLRALTDADRRAVRAAFPEPPAMAGFTEPPPSLNLESPTEAQAKAFTLTFEAWRARRDVWTAEHRAELEAYGDQYATMAIQRATERIRRAVAKVEQHGVIIAEELTYEQVKRLLRKIGEAQAVVLSDAIDRASAEVPEVPAGPLSRGSGDDPE